jgi:hypothetical protein
MLAIEKLLEWTTGIGEAQIINGKGGYQFNTGHIGYPSPQPSPTRLPCIHKSTQSHFPAKEGGIKLAQTLYKGRHSGGSLGLVT